MSQADPTQTAPAIIDAAPVSVFDVWSRTDPAQWALRSDWPRRAVMCLLLAVAVVVAFWGVWHNEFVYFDDPQYITNNVMVKLGLTWESVTWAFTHFTASNWHPLTWISHMADIQVYGLERPGGHHVTNLVLHAANTCLLFWILAAMTGAFWRSAMVAALFAVHPMHVESVIWVAERKDVLSTFMGLWTMIAFVWYARRPQVRRYLLVFFLFAVGLLCKPMLVTLPCVLLLLDLWPLRRLPLSRNTLLDKHTWQTAGLLVLEKVPLLVLSVISSRVTFLAQAHCGSVAPTDKLPIPTRFANAAVAYMRYIGKLFWPGDMTMFYPYQELYAWKVVAAIALLLVISLGVLAMLWFGRKYGVVGWLWYLGMLVPVIGFVQVGEQAFADRYTYLPYTGLFLILVWGLSDALGWHRVGRYALTAVAVTILGLCIYKTNTQVPYWRTSFDLLTRALEIEPRNAPILNNMGVLYWEQAEREKALGNAEKALEKREKALEKWRNCLEVRPDWVDAQNNYGVALQATGNRDEAIRWFQMARANSPVAVDARVNLGRALWDRDKDRQAIEIIQEAFRIEPNHLDAHCALATIYVEIGELPKAAEHLLRVIRLDPKRVDVARSAGDVLLRLGRMKDALLAYRILLANTPDDAMLLNNVAWTLATYYDPTVRNGAEAVALAERAVGLLASPHPAFLDTLAAAYAEAGRFPEAQRTIERAIALSQQTDPSKIPGLQQRAQLYAANQPFHSPAPAAPPAAPAPAPKQ